MFLYRLIMFSMLCVPVFGSEERRELRVNKGDSTYISALNYGNYWCEPSSVTLMLQNGNPYSHNPYAKNTEVAQKVDEPHAKNTEVVKKIRNPHAKNALFVRKESPEQKIIRNALANPHPLLPLSPYERKILEQQYQRESLEQQFLKGRVPAFNN